MNTSIALSKDYLNEVVSNYQELMNHIDEIIALSGYRKESVAEKLGLSKSDFYRKEHNKSFNLEEI
ncbi:MAG: hypothetical protein LBQ22_12110, partial [Bacteroidales bacterium]|nr:hypothetical protein [Bacteroidales bacterium]